MIRCLGNNVLLFPLPEIVRSPGGIQYPDNYRIGDRENQRFWVAAKGPKVTELNIYDHVLCPMSVEDHPRLEGGARVVDADQVIAKFENDPVA